MEKARRIHLVTFCFFIVTCAMLFSAPLIAEPITFHDQVLESDTFWSGEILVEGVIVVGRKATLRIAPGTVIRFKKIDTNHDGVGDSEIRVLGQLLATGTKGNRIRFESAEQKPASKDWSYVLLFTSSQKSEIRFCEFFHAFSGVQVHFSTARISDCLFADNHEGLRFGRARLEITHNTFRNNDTGIRFTRMEGPAIIRDNEIMMNGTGLFVAPSGQNIKDFFDPDRGGRAWNTGRLIITSNNVYNNIQYNLNLGEKQIWDLDVSGNWWGAGTVREITGKIFDRNRDPSLGRALYLPMARGRIKGAGTRGR